VAEFARYANKNREYKIVVFSAARHLDEKLGELTLRQILKKYRMKYYESADINNDTNLKREVTSNALGIAMGAAWSFEKKTVALFKKNHLLDFMSIDLPQYRGGAHHTWRILHRNNRGSINLQIIHGGLESFQKGEIIKRRKVTYPMKLKKPIDFINFQAAIEINFFKEFLAEIKKGESLKAVSLNVKVSSYYPFLYTKTNGLINWDWQAKDIYLFINAFDEPYPGASTYLKGKRVYLKDCHLMAAQEHYHPFSSGVVIRKNDKGIFIAACGNLLNVKNISDDKDRNIMDAVCHGDRFYTPIGELDKALAFKAVYGAKGLKKI